MKKSAFLFVMTGSFLLFTGSLTAQKKVTLEEVKKAEQQIQMSQSGNQGVISQTPVKTGAQPANLPVQNAQAAPQAPAVNPSAIPLTCTWDVTDYDFGKEVIQSKPASATFTVTNKGKEPVTITLVQPSCGCTSPKYTKEPIKPGEKGEVVLTYDAKVSGYFSKSAQVKLNDGQKYVLTIKGEVQKAQ